MNEILNFLGSVFIGENKSGKINFPLGKMKFWTHREFSAYHITGLVALGKALLAMLYLRSKIVYKLTKCT